MEVGTIPRKWSLNGFETTKKAAAETGAGKQKGGNRGNGHPNQTIQSMENA